MTAFVNLLNRPLFMSRSEVQERDRISVIPSGIVLQPWMVTLIISFLINAIGFAFAWGTVITRLDALSDRVLRIERYLDSEKTRGTSNHSRPPITGFGNP